MNAPPMDREPEQPSDPANQPPDRPQQPALGEPTTGQPSAGSVPLEINSEALLSGHSEVWIRHRGEIYRLTLTRSGKLILHK